MFRYDVGIEIRMPFLTQWLNSQMKKMLDGQKFTSDMEVQWVVHQWLRSSRLHFFASGIHKLVERWDKCLNKLGGYVEK